MVRLVVCDLDGTLLNSSGEITENTVTAINSLKEHGIEFVILTGRSYVQVEGILENAGLACRVIGMNGGEFVDSFGNSKCDSILSGERIKHIVDTCEDMNIVYQLYCEDRTITKELENGLEEMLNFGKLHCQDVKGILEGAILYYDDFYQNTVAIRDMKNYIRNNQLKCVKIVALSPDSKKLTKLAELCKDFEEISVVQSHMSNVEISNKDVHKGEAIKRLLIMDGVTKENVIGIGDNMNDLPMFQAVGRSVVVDNASLQIKEVADYITKSNDDDGVAYFINNEILVNK